MDYPSIVRRCALCCSCPVKLLRLARARLIPPLRCHIRSDQKSSHSDYIMILHAQVKVAQNSRRRFNVLKTQDRVIFFFRLLHIESVNQFADKLAVWCEIVEIHWSLDPGTFPPKNPLNREQSEYFVPECHQSGRQIVS